MATVVSMGPEDISRTQSPPCCEDPVVPVEGRDIGCGPFSEVTEKDGSGLPGSHVAAVDQDIAPFGESAFDGLKGVGMGL